MHQEPSVDELLSALRHFIKESAMPQLTGHAAFHARVALNAVDLIQRDIADRTDAEIAQIEALQKLLGSETSDLASLEAQLCEQIQSGDVNHSDKQLLDILRSATQQQLAIDQPRYSGYQESLKRHGDQRFVQSD